MLQKLTSYLNVSCKVSHCGLPPENSPLLTIGNIFFNFFSNGNANILFYIRNMKNNLADIVLRGSGNWHFVEYLLNPQLYNEGDDVSILQIRSLEFNASSHSFVSAFAICTALYLLIQQASKLLTRWQGSPRYKSDTRL